MQELHLVSDMSASTFGDTTVTQNTGSGIAGLRSNVVSALLRDAKVSTKDSTKTKRLKGLALFSPISNFVSMKIR